MMFLERAISSKFKIKPKDCKIEREADTGVCMFNYECYKKKGKNTLSHHTAFILLGQAPSLVLALMVSCLVPAVVFQS